MEREWAGTLATDEAQYSDQALNIEEDVFRKTLRRV